ncbi:hypothetical protein G4Z05_00510 [Bacillus thermocopriae]|uniref:Rho termination factor N-terminal domain-containing protein n=1 Tax=Neobacillus thermocopriae TaxID=1215031 RepID=A0A6B3TL87_9BACI|nr:hypothetical protein [Neobacillus thermocopriae]NEX77382.1 hypothetical protein [Neobacillus thermocopriae]
MLRPIRKTAAGIEYWDTKAKKVVVGGVNLVDRTDTPVNEINLSEMTVRQLRQYAADHDIDIPSDVTKKDDIIKLLSEVK